MRYQLSKFLPCYRFKFRISVYLLYLETKPIYSACLPPVDIEFPTALDLWPSGKTEILSKEITAVQTDNLSSDNFAKMTTFNALLFLFCSLYPRACVIHHMFVFLFRKVAHRWKNCDTILSIHI